MNTNIIIFGLVPNLFFVPTFTYVIFADLILLNEAKIYNEMSTLSSVVTASASQVEGNIVGSIEFFSYSQVHVNIT